ncbi:MAG: hypothetical protein QOD61_216, partial [Solirubrobacteraceae bacterium]|nr:hypothetical protein [Solirubrobacteraceae bacterium]
MPPAVELIRPDDLLSLRVEVVNLELDASHAAEPVLVRERPDEAAYLIVVFPPQTVAEPAYFAAADVAAADDRSIPPGDGVTEPIDPPGRPGIRRAAAQIGRSSRLVFKVPPGTRIPYSLAGLLDWSKLELSVNPIAAIGRSPTADQIRGAPAIAPPSAIETAIELPYRLVVSPTGEVAWRHRAAPFAARGRTELWHTRMRLKTPAGETELSRAATAPLRAIWSPDHHPPGAPPPAFDDPLGRTAMDADDRHQIVVLTSAFHGYETDLDLGGLVLATAGSGLVLAAGERAAAALGRATPAVARVPRPAGSAPARRLPVDATGRLGRAPAGLIITVPYVPQPFEVEQLHLSALGGWLRSRGHWDPPREARPRTRRPIDVHELFRALDFRLPVGDRPALDTAAPARPSVGRAPPPPPRQLDLSEWIHAATLGRDHYVRIVYEGELWPFRHRAALIKVTERKFVERGGIVGAYLLQRMFIVVREPVRTFAADDRGAPLKQVRLTTVVTPDIAPPANIAGTHRSFWVQILHGGAPVDFAFHAVGTDVAGHDVDFTVPLVFVSLTDVAADLKPVADEYNAASADRRQLVVPGQKVFLAEAHPDPAARTENTRLVTDALTYAVDAVGTPAQLLKAAVRIPQVNELLGTAAATTIALYPAYVKNGFDAAAGVFAQVVGDDLAPAKLAVEFSAEKAGGFATPNLGVSTLSRALGPLAGDAADAVTDHFDAQKFFPAGTAQLFGTFDLFKLLAGLTLGANAPQMHIKTTDLPPDRRLITAMLDWQPPVHTVDLDIAKFKPAHEPSKLVVTGTVETPVKLTGGPAGEAKSEFTGTLRDFQVSVLGCVFINFTKFAFATRSGQKTDVTVTLDPAKPVEFGGDLTFVEELRKAIPPDLFGSGPSLDISPTGVRAGFDLTLPPLA